MNDTAEAQTKVEQWWITTDFFHNHGRKVMGPFGTQDLALDVRALREKVEGHSRYFVDSETIAP